MIVQYDPEFIIQADSCLQGGGGFMGSHCYAYRYPHSVVSSMHISQLECYNCLIAVRVLAGHLRNTSICVVCDNSPSTASLASGRARDHVILGICRAFWFVAATHNIRFTFRHAPGETMEVADALSRQYLSPQDAERARKIVDYREFEYVSVLPEHCEYERFL